MANIKYNYGSYRKEITRLLIKRLKLKDRIRKYKQYTKKFKIEKLKTYQDELILIEQDIDNYLLKAKQEYR